MSTAQHPRTCGPGPRRWIRISSLAHPASCRGSVARCRRIPNQTSRPRLRFSKTRQQNLWQYTQKHPRQECRPCSVIGRPRFGIQGQLYPARWLAGTWCLRCPFQRIGCEPTFAGFEKLGSLKCPCDRMVVESDLLLAQQQVQRPAPSNMRPSSSAMRQDVSIRAARFFKGVGENRQAVEGSVVEGSVVVGP